MSGEFDLEKAERCLWGCAIGDSMGLPFEGVSSRRIAKFLSGRVVRQGFVFGNGMVSDDTDHSLIVARCLTKNPDDPDQFQCDMATELRRWLLSVPPGVGLATLRSILKLSIGCSPSKSGVFSAGNGPAMRSAIIGCLIPDNSELRQRFTEKSASLTHSDPKALIGAHAIAEIAAAISCGQWTDCPEVCDVLEILAGISTEPQWLALTEKIERVLVGDQPLEDFVRELGGKKGVSGYVYQTVPFSIVCWFRNFGNFPETIESCIRSGGDTDTTAAICGALAAISCEPESIPIEWKESILIWPLSRQHFKSFEHTTPCVASVLLRNVFSFAVILVHCVRRCLPPY